MNKIFKVIWSKSKQCYIVVSEMAKNHSGKKKIVVASILAAMAVGSGALVTDVSADPVRNGVSLAGGNTKTDATIAIGSGSYSDGTAVGGDGSRRIEPGIAIGVNAKAMGNSNVVMGLGSQIIGHSYGVAIGRTAQATDDYGVSVGYNTHADLHGIAMGEQSRAKKTGATSFGVSSRGYGNGAIAVGWQSLAGANVYDEKGVPNDDINSDNGKTINDYDKWGDVAIGVRTIATGGNATALGRGATASAANAIAIGGGDGGEPTKSGNTASDNKEKTKATAEKAVAIGYKALASDKNATSIGTDAQATQARATAIGYEVRAVGKNAVAIGSSGENSSRKLNSAGENAISIGTAAQANNLGSTAIGNLALASSNHAVAIGTSAEGTGASSTAIGHLVKATESNAFAAGSESLASGKNSISIGSTFNNITNQATGEASIAIGAAAQSKGAGSVALGRNVQALEKYTTAVGMNITASDNASASTILGYNSYTKANQSVNIGSTVKTEAGGQYSTAIGYTLSVSGKNAIGIGSSDDGITDDKKLMATGESSIAIGTRAQGKATGATAVGKEAVASQTDAIALGTSAQGTGEASTAIGNGANATNSHAFAAGVGASAAGTSGIAFGDNAVVGVAEVKDTNGRVTTAAVDAKHGVAIGTNAKVLAGQGSVALGWSTEVNASDVVNSSTDPGATRVSPYLLNNIGEDNSNDKGNGIVAIGTKRTSGGSGFARRLTGVAGAIGDYDAVNLKQLKALESNEWLLRTQNVGDRNPTEATPQTVNGETKKRITLKGSENISISNTNGVVTLNVTNVVKSVATDNTNALDISNTNGTVKINPKLASSVNAAGEANKLVTAGTVKTALDLKVNKADELHVKPGNYTVQSSGDVSLIQENANSQTQGDKGFTIKDVAKKSVVDTLQSDYNTFKMKAITFTGDDTQGVARTLDTTLTVKGGANYTSTTPNTNIRVEKDAANGANGLLVKLSDKLSGMKEIAGTGSQDLVIKNGNTIVTVKAPANGDKGTVDFGDAKVIAKNLDASIAYKAGNGDTKKTVKLQDGFNFTAATDTAANTDVPKSGLAITTGTNGVVTFGLDKATRNTIDNAADKNLSNLTQDGKNKVTELAKTAAKEAVKVAPGLNTTVTTDTSTAGVTTYKVNANDTTVAAGSEALTINNATPDTNKVRAYTVDLSAVTKGKLAAVGNLATNVIGGTTIAADGTVTGPTFSITNAAGTAENAGTIKEAIEKLDAANKGQNTNISGNTEKITKLGETVTNNYTDLSTKITQAGTNVTNALTTKGLNFTGNDTTDAGKVHRDLGTTLTIKGAENFTREANAKNNIDVVKNTAGDGFDVKLAANLTNMKEISGNGKDDLVIKNGDATITLKPKKEAEGTNPATSATVDFGETKVVASNLDANIAYKAGSEDTKKKVKLQDGFNFTTATDATTTAEGPKSGLAITTGDNGVVTFGLDKATRSTIDNAADKNLSNLSDAGKNKVKELAKGAAQDAVKVADGINTTVEKDTATAGVTTYKVNANDTTVAVTGDGLAITGGDLGTDKVRKYSLDLSAATKGKLAAVGNLATNVIGGTTVNVDGTVVGPTFSITKADGTNETANTLKDAIDKLNATNAGQNTKISETAGKVTTLEGKVDGIVEKGMVFAGDDAAADKVTRKLGETLNIHGQNNITVKKDGTAADTLNVKLASELKNITSISSGNGTTGSTVTLGADGVSIANTKDGATKTVTIGKDGINAGGMKITNVGEAKAEGDAANKKYVDDAISNLGNIVSGNATLNFAGNVTKNAQDQATEKVGLSLATGTLHVNGAENEITTTAKGDTITVGLAQAVKDQLAKVGDTASNGRDGKDGASGAKGLTGKDGLNDKTLTDKVNALRNGEAGSVVYTDENGARLVKAKDGQYYKVTDVDATGNVLNNANPATTVEARVVNPDGTTTGGTTKLSNIADGKVAAGSKDAVNGGQLYNAKSEIGAIIGGTTINENGKITGPTFNITSAEGTAENAGTIKEAIEKLDAANKGQNTKISGNTEKLTKLGETVTTNYNDLSKKITDGATNITNTLTTKGLDFTGNDITDAGKLHRDLGTTLTIKGTENFTRAATENNIKVVKNGDALDVKLAENLAKMKEISGDGTSDLVIKNGDTKVTVKAPTNGEKGTVDFGDAKVIAKNLDTSIAYKSNQDTAKKTVKLQDGFNFTAATDTTTTAEGPKSGLAITTGDNGVVTFGLDKATRSTIDNAADKNLSNLSDAGKDKVKELAKGAAQDAVKVADGINTTVTTDTTTAGVTTYKVNANDTTVAVNADTLAISGGTPDATTKVRAYTLDLSDTVKAKLNAINNVGDTASNGRDGVNGTSGAQGLTGKDGLNGKTLTDKVNALRNGEAGSVVYTDENGARLVKAKDGQYYKATDVDATGNVLNNANPATTVEARVVNPNGETTAPTKLSNIADGKVAANSKDAVNGGQLHTVKSDLATALGGDSKVNADGSFTGPTYSVTKADGTGKETVSNVGEAISKLDTRITTANGALVTKGLDFTGNDTTDAGKVHRNLGETLTIKGADNFTRTDAETNNIKVVNNNNDLDVKLAENLGNIKSISNSTGAGKPGSTITLGADGVSIANTTTGADGAAGATKTVTIGKDGINAGGMKITNVTKAEADGDAANKKYVDDAISNLGNIVSGNATLNFAGNVTKDAQDQVTEKVGLSLATGTLHVNGANNEITTTAKGDTITVGLAETVKAQLAKVGDTASNGRDGKDGTSGPKGLTGKDGLNDKTLTDKVNALRNGEAGSVVYTDENGARLVKAKDGEYYKAADVDATGNVLNGATKATTVEARVVNPDGTTTGGTTKLSNIADGKVAAGSKDAVNGGQLHTTKSEIGAIIGGTTINENGKITGPTFSITNAAGTKDDVTTIKDAIEKLDATNAAQNTKISETTEKLTNLGDTVTNNYNDLSKKITDGSTNITNTLTTKGLDFTGNDTTAKVHRDLGTTLTIKGADNFTRTATETNNIKVVKTDNDLDVKLAENLGNIKSISNATGAGKPGSTITLGADGVSIANTAAGADGAAGETKTVTIGKDGINAGGMKVTNVAKAEADGDAANKAYVDDAIKNLNTTVTNNANLRYAGDTNEGAGTGEDHLNLPLATGTLKVAGTADQIKTVASNGTITLSLAEKVKNKLDKLGDTAADGRDGKAANGQAGDAGNAGDKGATGKDGLNGTNLTDKVNALRNGEAGSVVYTDENGERLVKANNGNYYKTTDVDKTGNVVNNAQPATTVEARVVNPDGTTTGGTTKLSNIADGKVAANSKDAVNGGQLHTAKSEIGAIIGGTTINENGKITGPTFSITNAEGTAENAGTIKEAIEKLDAANKGQNTKISETAGKVTTLEGKVDGIVEKGMVFAGDDAAADKVTRKLGETLNIHGQNNITVKKDGTAADTLNVKLASDLKNITSITNADADGKPGSKITLGADGVSIANTAAGADGAAGETKTVTIGKDGINAGGMKITNVTKAEADGDAANKKYVDDAIKNLNTTVTNNANLRYAGDTNEGAVNGEDHLNLPLATGTLKVAGTADQIKTVANNGTITLSLDKKVTDKLAKLGDTASNGRDGKDGTSGAQGLTGKDGLNDKTLTDKVNALRNGEAGSVVYTNDAGDRVVKAKDGKYYKADEVKADGTVKTAEENNGKAPKVVENPQARVVNGNGETTVPTTLSNIADGKVAANSKDAVNGGQLHTVKSDLATALGGDSKVNADGSFTGPTYNITKDDGSNTKEEVKNVGDAISKLDGRINNANTTLATKGLDFTGNDTTDAGKVHRNLGETLTIKGADNFTRTDAETNNIKVVKNNNDLDVKLAENLGNIKSISNATGAGKPGSTITLGADGVSIANTAAGADGAAGETKTVTIGKDGINAGGMKVTNVAKATENGDAANKEYVDEAISNLNTTVTNNANLRYAGDTNVGAANGEDHLNLPLATGTLKVAGTADQIKTVANNGTITLSLDEKVTDKLAKLGDTASNGRDGKDGTSGAQGLTGKDGLNDKTLTDKVNALRNGEAGSVVYTNDAGDRVVKAKDGKYYKADEVKADGTVKTPEENNGKAPKVVENPQARVVNGNGETTVPTTLSNIADGKVAANSKDAVNGGQLHTVKSDLATALGGDSKVNADGSFTGPTYNITKDDGTGKEAVNNVGDAISKLDGRINNANTALGNKGLDFYGNKDAADTDKVHRNLGEALKVKGAENFTREANAKNNIDVVKNTAGDGFDVKLAENLGNIKEIAGNGKDNLVIKNGDATITLKPKKEAEGTNPATPATVDFGNTKVVASNLDASITYRANSAEDADAKTVKLQKGLNFVSGDGTTATAETAKAGITIAADKDGKVVFGLNEATRNAIDNAADKNLSNLSDDGKNKVKELAKTAAQESVKVASGNNVTVTPETKDGVTTYTVNGRDTTVKAAENGSVSVSGGTLNDKGEREYTVDLTDAAKAEIAKVAGIDKRLGEAEKAIADNKTAINTNKDNIKANKDAIDANKDAIKANKDAIDANKKAVDEDIKALKGNTATKDLDNVSDKGKEVITGLIDVKGENGVTVTPSADATSKVKTFTVKIGDSATFGKGDKAVAIDGTKGSVTVGDKDKANTAITPEGVTVTTKNADGTDKSKVEIKDGTISGLTNTDWDPTKVATAEDAKKDPTSATAKERGKAATQGQIKDVVEKIVNGRGFEGDDNKKVSVALGDTLGIKGGATGPLTDNNIGIVSTEAKDGKPATMTVKLAKDVNMKDGSTSYDNYVPKIKVNPDGSKEIVKNADGTVKYQLGKDGKPIHITTTVNAGGVTIAPDTGSGIPTVSLTADGLDNGGNQIHNVAAGTLNTDAATVGQVRAAAHALNNRVNEAGAHAAALAAMNPLSYDPLKKSQVMAGVGSYKGNKALALGVAHYANEDTLFNVGVAVGDGSNMVNAGVTYRFGGEDSAVPERYKGGPISSVYVMQDEVSALKAENAEMKEQMKMLMERIEMLAAK